MPKPIAYQQLPDDVRSMDPEEQESFLMKHGYYLVPDMGMKVPGAQAILKDRAGVVDTPHTEDVMGFGPGLTHPENSKAMMRAGVGVGSLALGGAGRAATLIGGALNAGLGPDVDTGRGVAENAANVVFGRLAPFMNAGKLGALGPKMTALKNAALGAGQYGTTQVAGNLMTKDPIPMTTAVNPFGAGLAAGASAGLPMAAGRLAQAAQNSTAMTRRKMQPIIDRLTKGADAQPIPTQTPSLPSGPQLVTPPTPASAVVPPQGSNPFKESARSLKAEKLAAMLQQHGISPDDAALMQDEQWSMLAKAAGVNPPSKDTVQATMGMLRGQTAASKPVTPSTAQPSNQPVSAQPSQNDDLEEQMRKSLLARGVPPEKLPPVSASVAAPSTAAAAETALPSASPSPLSALDEMAQRNPKASAFQKLGGATPSEYIAKTIDGNEWGSLPSVLRDMDDAFPEGSFRQAVKSQITEKVLSGVGTAGAFGDLTPLQRVQAFGKQKFGEKTGAQIINQIYDSPEAYRNLSDLQEIIEASGRGPEKAGGLNHLKVFVNRFSPVLGGTAFGLTMYVPVLQNPAVAGAAAAGTIYKAFTLTADSLSDYLGKKNTKWADVLYDLATGGNRYSAQSVSNVISGLRRRAEDERDLKREEAEAEMAQFQ